MDGHPRGSSHNDCTAGGGAGPRRAQEPVLTAERADAHARLCRGVGAGPPGPTGRGLWPRLVLNRRCLWTVHLPPCLRTWRPRSAPIQRDADRCPMHPVWAPGLSPLGRSHEPRVVLGWPVDQQQMSLMPSPATEPTWPECPVVLECQALWSQPPLLPKGPPGTQNPALWDECPAMC